MFKIIIFILIFTFIPSILSQLDKNNSNDYYFNGLKICKDVCRADCFCPSNLFVLFLILFMTVIMSVSSFLFCLKYYNSSQELDFIEKYDYIEIKMESDLESKVVHITKKKDETSMISSSDIELQFIDSEESLFKTNDSDEKIQLFKTLVNY